jgi:hypothetical protein
MPFSVTWHTITDQLDGIPSDATFVTPLSDRSFRISDVQEHRLLISYRDQDGTIPLKREQFETLYDRVTDTRQSFELDRLPTDAEPYATILSIHPRFEVDQREGLIRNTDDPTPSALVDVTLDTTGETPARQEPDLSLYADSLLLVDAGHTTAEGESGPQGEDQESDEEREEDVIHGDSRYGRWNRSQLPSPKFGRYAPACPGHSVRPGCAPDPARSTLRPADETATDRTNGFGDWER